MPRKKSKSHQRGSSEDSNSGSEDKNYSTVSSHSSEGRNAKIKPSRRSARMGNNLDTNLKYRDRPEEKEVSSKARSRNTNRTSPTRRHDRDRDRSSSSSSGHRRKKASSKKYKDSSSRHRRKSSESGSDHRIQAASAFVSEIRSRHNISAKKSQVKFSEPRETDRMPWGERSRSKPMSSLTKSPSRKTLNVNSKYDDRHRSRNEDHLHHHHHQHHHRHYDKNRNNKSDDDSNSEGESRSGSFSVERNAAPPIDPTLGAAGGLHVSSKHRSRRSDTRRRSPMKNTSTASFISTTQLNLVSLPINTSIDEMKDLFPAARAIKMVLIRAKNKYQRNATIEFVNSKHAYDAYKSSRNAVIGDSAIKFDFTPIKPKDNENGNNEEDHGSVATIEDLLPKAEVDKEAMIRNWISIQRGFLHRKSRNDS